jgi:hypothetical protein
VAHALLYLMLVNAALDVCCDILAASACGVDIQLILVHQFIISISID